MVNPASSRFCAYSYLSKSTPMKKLRKKKEPIKMKIMKKSDWAGLASIFGPLSLFVTSSD